MLHVITYLLVLQNELAFSGRSRFIHFLFPKSKWNTVIVEVEWNWCLLTFMGRIMCRLFYHMIIILILFWLQDGAETGYGAKAQEVLGQVKGRCVSVIIENWSVGVFPDKEWCMCFLGVFFSLFLVFLSLFFSGDGDGWSGWYGLIAKHLLDW